MSFAFMPFYTGDYLRDTRHLSCAEHGIYQLLLIYCWDQQGPAPLDERKQAAIVNARSSDEIEALRRVLSDFFTRMADAGYKRGMQLEIERAAAISMKRKSAGAKGYQAKAKHLPSKSKTSAKQVPLHLQPQPHSQPQPQPDPPLSLERSVKEGSVSASALRALARENGRPTHAEIEKFCIAENLNVDHAKFSNHYQATSWKTSNGNHVEDWQALLRKWHQQDLPASATFDFSKLKD